MAGEKLTDIAASNNLVTSLSPDALLVATNNPNTNPTTVVIHLSDFKKVVGFFTGNTTPANSTALSITAGNFFYDQNYGYIATSNNVVKRFALSSF